MGRVQYNLASGLRFKSTKHCSPRLWFSSLHQVHFNSHPEKSLTIATS